MILKSKNQGFTLIEMVVAVGVFTIVIVITLASFLNISDIQNKSIALRVVNDNINFAVETMVRDIRTGKNYCSSCSGSSMFNFTNSRGEQVVYRLSGGVIERSSDGGLNFISLTSEEVNIDNFVFTVTGEEVGDAEQPLVTINISGSAGKKGRIITDLSVQATVSQRSLDS